MVPICNRCAIHAAVIVVSFRTRSATRGTTFYGTNSYTYLRGLVRTHTDERGLTVTNTWDPLQRLLRVDYSDGSSIVYTYSNLDLVQVVDRMGFTNSYAYDSMRRTTNHVDALGRMTSYAYCTCGSLDSILDALGNETHFYYDLAGRLTNTAYADGYSVSRGYTFGGLLNYTLESSGYGVTNTYDSESRLLAVNNPAGLVSARAYDLCDRVITNVDANGVTNTITYDLLGRIRTRAYPDGGLESFGYSHNRTMYARQRHPTAAEGTLRHFDEQERCANDQRLLTHSGFRWQQG